LSKYHASITRKKTNGWIAGHAAEVTGKVLSIGSGSDDDWEGQKYRTYFPLARYHTSDIHNTKGFRTDLIVDARKMDMIATDEYDCLLCLGVIEHIDDMFGAMSEMARVLKPGGTFLFGVPFGFAIHRPPQDFWRMTIHGLRYLLERFGFEEEDVLALPGRLKIKGFDACYLSKSRRKEVV